MQPIQPKIVFFDIDDTLYIKDEKQIPQSIFEQVIPRLKAKGIIPAIATGRCIGAFPAAVKALLENRTFELLVTINGQYNCYQEQTITDYPLKIERIETALQTLKQLNITYACVSRNKIGVSSDDELVQKALAPLTNDYVVEPDLYKHEAIYQLLAFFSEERENEVRETGILGNDLKILRWHPDAVDLLNKTNSKARGIQDVLQHFGLNFADAMAFGDGLNDIEMLEKVGIGVAMGNAVPELKVVANYITRPISQDGILYALEQLHVI